MEVGDISALPEACMAIIISLTSPLDACRSSLVSPLFKAAADSDFVWDRFLPPRDYYNQFILQQFTSKKQLFFWLCDHPVLLQGGNKSLNLQRKNGKKCIMIGAKELKIVWGDTPRYWGWESHPNSRFEQVARLNHVWWFKISGKLDTGVLSPRTTYAVYFVVKFDDDAFGLADAPTEVKVQFVEGGTASGTRNVYLDSEEKQSPHSVKRGDGWMEIELGEFYNDEGEDGEVEMCLKEVAGHLKSGLIVEGIEVRPKE